MRTPVRTPLNPLLASIAVAHNQDHKKLVSPFASATRQIKNRNHTGSLTLQDNDIASYAPPMNHTWRAFASPILGKQPNEASEEAAASSNTSRLAIMQPKLGLDSKKAKKLNSKLSG